jgi:molybdate transport system regulatory protein
MKQTAASSSKPGRSAPVARFRLRVMAGESIAVGPGKIDLLEAIRDTGSITAAAKAMGMSYRRAWMLVDEVNRSLKKPAIASAIGGDHGGGSELTDVGQLLVRTYRHIESTASTTCSEDLAALTGLIRRAGPPSARPGRR